MKILFINLTVDADNNREKRYSHPRHKLPPLDIGYCAAIAEQEGHEARFCDTWVEKLSLNELTETAAKYAPDIVVIKPEILTFALTLKLAEMLKGRLDTVITVMGPVATTNPEEFVTVNGPIDAAIIGEPEETFRELLKRRGGAMDISGMPGLRARNGAEVINGRAREPIGDLDSLPLPLHKILLEKKYTFQYPVKQSGKVKFAAVLATRGCPNECAHCSPVIRVSYGKAVRHRSPENILKEIVFLRELGVNVVYFCDDNFTADRGFVEALCEAFGKMPDRPVWAVQGRADTLDRELLEKMHKAGCRCINIGIETVSPEIMKHFGKCLDIGKIEAVVLAAREIGININADFIIGTPWETAKDIEETLAFARRMNFALVTILTLIPYPGAALYKALPGSDKEQDSLYRLTQASDRSGAIERKRRNFYLRYYFRPGYIAEYFRNVFSLRNFRAQAALMLSFMNYLRKGH